MDPVTRQRASLAVNSRVSRLAAFRRARHVAAYVGSKGEIDPMPLLYMAHLMGKACYLPVLHPFLPSRLWFMRWTPDMPMVANRFGIPEPPCDIALRRGAQWMDLILMPLLGFDRHCHRLGMGGGFYDRTLAFTRGRRLLRRPLLIGLAHDAQRCEDLPVAPWDVSPHMIVTPTACVACHT
ncbi:5-formyltetrahydrofolate cyclo-ligase [endosymbiont of unidentified scaly snail isolate Monju]|nr:5-formyltetrahydrofolate cyclo-ligase [endosymbiont of unidentified scaly snail isolate Monju]